MSYESRINLAASSKMVSVGLFQDQLDGLHALILWLHGLKCGDGGKHMGTIPGEFELIMHYRSVRSAVLALGDSSPNGQ